MAHLTASRLKFVQVEKSFGALHVLRGVSLTVQAGHVHYIIGRSGAGKSVLIKQVVGLLQPDKGQIFLDEQDLTRLSEPGFFEVRRTCQLIFQHATLFDAMTVLENVAMPVRKRFGLAAVKARQTALSALESVGGSALVNRYPPELGAGVKKRIAIARALALKPQVLLYDEPTTSLDPVSARRIDRLIRQTTDVYGLTSVVVSHDLASVRSTGDRVTFLHEGRVHFDGTPTDLFASADAIVREFVHGTAQRWSANDP